MDIVERMFYDALGDLLKSVKNEWWRIKFSDAQKLFKTLLDIDGVKIFGRNPGGSIYLMELRERKSLYRLFYILNKWYQSKDPKIITDDPDPPIVYIIGEENEAYNRYGRLQFLRT